MIKSIKAALMVSMLGALMSLPLVLADSESGGVFYGGGDSEASGVLWGRGNQTGYTGVKSQGNSESGGPIGAGYSESGGPFGHMANSESGGPMMNGGHSMSGYNVLWGDGGNESDSGGVELWGNNHHRKGPNRA